MSLSVCNIVSSKLLLGYTTKMYLSKGQYEGVSREFPVKGKAVSALKRWLERKNSQLHFQGKSPTGGSGC